MDLCDTAARVVLMTTGTELSKVSQPVRMALKLSDVKVLYEAKPLEVAGEGEVERVRVHDLNEDEEYELAADAVLMLDSE
jgi:thioredoxin reductase